MPRDMRARRAPGFTLVELIVAMTVLAILATLAVPAFTAHFEKARLRSAADAVVALVAEARLAAVKQARAVSVQFTGHGAHWCVGAREASLPSAGMPMVGVDVCDCLADGDACVVDARRAVVGECAASWRRLACAGRCVRIRGGDRNARCRIERRGAAGVAQWALRAARRDLAARARVHVQQWRRHDHGGAVMLTRGFTLVELLVALALGLLVIAAALGFFLQLLRAGTETVLATRLQQELRTTMSLVVAEVRRARASGTDVVVSPGCLRGAEIAIREHLGKIEVQRGAGVDCGSAGLVIGSDTVRVTALAFVHDAAVNDRRVEIALRGTLRNPPAFVSAREATLRHVVALRSNGG